MRVSLSVGVLIVCFVFSHGVGVAQSKPVEAWLADALPGWQMDTDPGEASSVVDLVRCDMCAALTVYP